MPGNNKNLVIAIAIGAGNRPVLDHDCHVVSTGGTVTWRGPAVRGFTIRFETSSPSVCKGKDFPSRPENGHHVARLKVAEVARPETHKYSVIMGEVVLDPYIIVDPN